MTARLQTRPTGRPAAGAAGAAAELHPVAWWIWALAMAAVADRTTNPLLLALILAVAALVVASCRPPAGESSAPGGFGAFLRLGLVVLAIRTVFHILLGSTGGRHVLFTVPTVPLPDWATGIQLGGPVYADGLIAALYDAFRLAVMLCCIGVAVTLANPRRLMASLPGALYEVGVAVVVGMSLAPDLISSSRRVHRARELRGDPAAGRGPLRRLRAWATVAMPVLADATDHALALAASMDARGFGRSRQVPRATRRLTGGLVLLGLLGLCLGVYGLLDATSPAVLTVPALVIGIAAMVAGLALGGRRVHRTRYRAAPWRIADIVVAGSGLVALFASVAAELVGVALDPADVLAAPALPLVPFAGILVAAAPALLGNRR